LELRSYASGYCCSHRSLQQPKSAGGILYHYEKSLCLVSSQKERSHLSPAKHITNNHLLSPNESINYKIRNLKAGQQIKIKGHLVQITYPNGAQQTSSQSRSDQGYAPVWERGDPGVARGSCEIILIESIQIKK
jgi:hypothetical protein